MVLGLDFDLGFGSIWPRSLSFRTALHAARALRSLFLARGRGAVDADRRPTSALNSCYLMAMGLLMKGPIATGVLQRVRVQRRAV